MKLNHLFVNFVNRCLQLFYFFLPKVLSEDFPDFLFAHQTRNEFVLLSLALFVNEGFGRFDAEALRQTFPVSDVIVFDGSRAQISVLQFEADFVPNRADEKQIVPHCRFFVAEALCVDFFWEKDCVVVQHFETDDVNDLGLFHVLFHAQVGVRLRNGDHVEFLGGHEGVADKGPMLAEEVNELNRAKFEFGIVVAIMA